MTIARPKSLGGALDALRDLPDAHLLAGGTDFMVEVNFGHRRPRHVIGVRRVLELQDWERSGSEVSIGSMVTYSEMLGELGADVPALAMAARTVGSPQIRNAGTIGGNVATASPAGDALPPLIALNAQVELDGVLGSRVVPLPEFITGVKRTSRRPGELIRRIRVAHVEGPQQFLKVGSRNAMVISISSLALIMDVTGRRVSCGLGAVAPVPLRPRKAEEFISNEIDWSSVTASDGAIARFAELTAEACSPIGDHRSSAEYRSHTVRVIARRALERCLYQ